MKMKKIAALTLATLTMTSLLMTGCSSDSSSKTTAEGTTKIKIMCGGLEKQIYMPAKLTEALGYFKDQGLDVQLMNEASGQTAEEALIAGQIDAVVGFYDHTIDLQTKGKHLESIVQLAATPGETLMVLDSKKDEIKTLADLKGKNIGVTGLGSSTNFLANYLVVKGGNTQKDYTPVPIGAGNTLIAAMEQGRVQLAVTTEPTVSMLKAKHLASPFVDMSSVDGTNKSLGGVYPASSVYMQTDFVKGHPDTAQKVANAFVKTLQWMHSHSPEEIAAKMPQEYYAGDKDMYVNALKGTLPMFTADGKMPADGPKKVLDVLSAFNNKIKPDSVKLEETFTTEFVDKVK